jgi:hypothetical protein
MTATTFPGALVVFTDMDPDHEEDFNHWYNTQHLGERLAVPGFVSARRLVSLGGGIEYLAFYETDSVAVLASAAYRKCLDNPTEWTQRTMPWFRNMTRSCCNVTIDTGAGVGGCAIVCAFTPNPNLAEELQHWLSEDWCAKVKAGPEVLRVRLCETDPEITGVPNPEAVLRGERDQSAGWTLMLDVVSEAAAARLLRQPLLQSLSTEPRFKTTVGPTMYRLLCYINKS